MAFKTRVRHRSGRAGFWGQWPDHSGPWAKNHSLARRVSLFLVSKLPNSVKISGRVGPEACWPDHPGPWVGSGRSGPARCRTLVDSKFFTFCISSKGFESFWNWKQQVDGGVETFFLEKSHLDGRDDGEIRIRY